jgi:hypothetical protein
VAFAKVTELGVAVVTVKVPLYADGENPETEILDPTVNGVDKELTEPQVTGINGLKVFVVFE